PQRPQTATLFPYTTLFRSEQFAEMPRRIDGPTGRINGCRYKTVYANFHLLVIHAATRCWKRPAKAERTLRNTTTHSTVTTRARGDRKSTRLNSSHLGISYA